MSGGGPNGAFRCSGTSVLGIVGAEVAIVIKRADLRLAFHATVGVPFSESRGCYVRPWGLRGLYFFSAAELVSAIAAEGLGGIEAYREISARQRTELAGVLALGEPVGPNSHGFTSRGQPRGKGPRGLERLGRKGACVDLLVAVNGRNERWRGVVVRPPVKPTDSVEIKPHGVDVESVTIEIVLAQVLDVGPFDPRAASAHRISEMQRVRLGAPRSGQ